MRLLSSGQAKRATLARVAASGAPLWLLDEPLNALDADGAERLARLVAAPSRGRRGGARRLAPAAARRLAQLELGAMIGALIARDVRRGLTGAAWLPVAFFLLVATLVPFAVGPDARLLARIGAGALWIAALTAALLPIERLIEPDRADGVLDQLALHGLAEESVAAAKIAAHWLTFAPLLLLAAVPGVGAAGDGRRRARPDRDRAGRSERPGLAALAVAVAAVTAGLPRAGSLAGLLLLPLAVPLLIFGAASGGESALLLEAAVSLLLTAGAPFVAGAAIRAGYGPSLDQRAKIAVGRSSPRASSRTAISPTSTVPPRSPSVCRTSSPIASADIRTA